ncbi:MAG TPA: DUF362 domain-containing protein, partial [Candidatus Limnocylindrales bacterium]|nr:DUF362 domain-containing protein [Candidatus Limnocylindrales bacterium]
RQSLQMLLEPWGGIGALVKPGQKVLLKPNLLAPAHPSEAVTTHPLIVKVMAELIHEVGGKAYIGDSPGSGEQEVVHKKTGMWEVMQETGAEMLLFDEAVSTVVHGFEERTFPLASALGEVDMVFNLAKLKTHSLVGLTAAVKNTYGCIVGKSKGSFHYKYPMPLDFSRLVIDVYLAAKPAFSIIDAVIAMEGVGPRRGKPRQLGLLMASANAVALDSVAAAVTGFRPEQVTTIDAARKLRLPGADLADLHILGVPLEECKVNDFDQGVVAAGKFGRLLTRFPLARIRGWFGNRRPYPRINGDICNGCGICFENCPAQIVNFNAPIPDIDLEGCIRCYCCQELCPQGAVEFFSPRGSL